MNRSVITFILQSISNCLHPLLMLTYAAVGLVLFTPLAVYPTLIKGFIVGEVFFYTCLIPVLVISLLYKLNIVGHWALRDRSDRLVPLGINALAYVVCVVALTRQGWLPSWGMSFYYGAILLAVVCWIVSFWWKISAHATGVASFATAMLLLYISFPTTFPLWLPLVAILVCGLVCSIRLYLGRHTLAQVAAGSCVGVIAILASFWCFA